MDPKLIVFQAEHHYEPKNCISKVCENTEFKDRLKFVLHAILSQFFLACRLRLLYKEATSVFLLNYENLVIGVITVLVVCRLRVHDAEQGAHEQKKHAVDNLAPDKLTFVVLVHFFLFLFQFNFDYYLL